MANISFSRSHQLSLAEIRSQAEELAMALMDKVGGDFCWRDNSVYYTCRGVIARIDCSSSDILVDIRLAFVTTLIRGRIEQVIDEAMDRLLNLRKGFV